MNEEPLFDIVPQHRSILYRSFLNTEGLVKALREAIAKGANVVSIRRVVRDEGQRQSQAVPQASQRVRR
jgi:hypothetical protein